MGPEADEVVPPGSEAVQVAREVEPARPLAVLLEDVPMMRAGQVDGAAVRLLEIARAGSVDAERHREI
jgi:hypothetical protein